MIRLFLPLGMDLVGLGSLDTLLRLVLLLFALSLDVTDRSELRRSLTSRRDAAFDSHVGQSHALEMRRSISSLRVSDSRRASSLYCACEHMR